MDCAAWCEEDKDNAKTQRAQRAAEKRKGAAGLVGGVVHVEILRAEGALRVTTGSLHEVMQLDRLALIVRRYVGWAKSGSRAPALQISGA